MPVTDRLSDVHLPDVLRELGLRPADVAEAVAAARVVADRPALQEQVTAMVRALCAGLGHFPDEPGGYPPWSGYAAGADPLGPGVLPLLALVLSAENLAAYHHARRVPRSISAATLTELGQQVWVHRQTFDRFGLHTYDWLPLTWSGSLYWLGRLQFNLQWLDGRWVCSTHIPRSGPLNVDAVDRALASAEVFFRRYFPDRPVTEFWCASWLLDPELAAGLDPRSNIARFARRWRLYGEPVPADDDAVFFTFARRDVADLAELPQDTSLQRLVVGRLRDGGHWRSATGLLPMGPPVVAAAQ